MILIKNISVKKHSSLVKKMKDLNIQCVDNYYTLPVELFLKAFPKSNLIKVEYICSICNNINTLSAADYTSKKYKEVCGSCLKSKVLVGSKSNAFGKEYCKGIQKSAEHKEKLKGPRPCIAGHLNPNWKSDTSEYKRYKGRVHQLSNKTYEAHKDEINPFDYPRTICGKMGGWQLDHKISIRECFNRGYSVEEASDINNLQMLPWKDNLLKSVTSDGHS